MKNLGCGNAAPQILLAHETYNKKHEKNLNNHFNDQFGSAIYANIELGIQL